MVLVLKFGIIRCLRSLYTRRRGKIKEEPYLAFNHSRSLLSVGSFFLSSWPPYIYGIAYCLENPRFCVDEEIL